LVERFGLFGEKRRYTVATYFSNRLDIYSQKPESLLYTFTRYSKVSCKTTESELKKNREKFGGSWVAVSRKKTQ